MRTRRVFALALLIVLVAASSAQAQFWARFTNPRVTVDLQHPPGLDIRVERIAFGPATGQCSNEIIQQLIDAFVSNGVEVVDRQSIDRLLAEQDFSLSGYVDRSTAAELGRLLGPSAMIMLDVTRCAVEKKRFRERLRRNSRRPYLYIAQTQAFIRASVRSVDLATGTIFAARSIEHSPYVRNESTEGRPVFPEDFAVLDHAYARVSQDIERMFLPWTEPRELVFFDDKDCGLDQAFQALKNGNTERAFDISLSNLEACQDHPEAEEKDLGQAHYNVGMAYMILGEYDQALEHLHTSAELRPGDIVEEAIADTEEARDLLAAMRQVDERAEIELQRQETEAMAQDAAKLTNADVVEMVQQNLPESIILAKIQSSECAFDTSGSALVELNDAGVGENVIMAMLSAQ